jgi:hypothetical protein
MLALGGNKLKDGWGDSKVPVVGRIDLEEHYHVHSSSIWLARTLETWKERLRVRDFVREEYFIVRLMESQSHLGPP